MEMTTLFKSTASRWGKSVYVLLIAALLLTTGGCRHKDFCYHHPHGEIYVEVEYDDDNDPDDIEYLRDNVSATRLYAYDDEEGDMIMMSDIERKTTTMLLGADTYHFIAHNAGTQTVSFDGRDQFHSHITTTRECDILEPLYGSRAVSSDIDLGNGEPVVIAAEPLWSIGAEARECNLGDTIRLTAIPLHCRYTYEIRDIEGLAGVLRVSSFITGMSRGVTLDNTALHDVPVTVAVPAQVSADGKSIVGSFMCFGNNPLINARHRMGLFIEMENGRKYKLLEDDNFDVTEQVTGAANRRRVHIVIDGIKLPEPESVGSGFEIVINPWGEGENIDIDYDFGKH